MIGRERINQRSRNNNYVSVFSLFIGRKTYSCLCHASRKTKENERGRREWTKTERGKTEKN